MGPQTQMRFNTSDDETVSDVPCCKLPTTCTSSSCIASQRCSAAVIRGRLLGRVSPARTMASGHGNTFDSESVRSTCAAADGEYCYCCAKWSLLLKRTHSAAVEQCFVATRSTLMAGPIGWGASSCSALWT